MHVIDTPRDCTNKLRCLQQAGIDIVFRYYARDKQAELPEKRLTHAEAIALSQANISIGVCYQYYARSKDAFSDAIGKSDGAFARKYAAATIGQPAHSAIYFGVDYDPPTHELESNIVPHFQAIARAMVDQTVDYPRYDVGVYGAWHVCDRLVKAGVVKYAWLAQSTGWGDHAGRAAYVASNAWTIMQGYPHGDLCNLDYDPNEIKLGIILFGQFVVAEAS